MELRSSKNKSFLRDLFLEKWHADRRLTSEVQYVLATFFLMDAVSDPRACTRKAFCAPKCSPSARCFNDFDFGIALAPQRGANLADLHFKKCSDHASLHFNDFDFRIAVSPQRGANFAGLNFKKRSEPNDFDFRIALAIRRGANFGDILGSPSSANPVFPSYLCEPAGLQNDILKTQRVVQCLPASILMSHICAVSICIYHACAVTSLCFSFLRCTDLGQQF